VEQTAEPIPPVHTVPIPADDGRIGRWIGRLQTKFPEHQQQVVGLLGDPGGVGARVTPTRWTRRVSSSMKNRT
jgi:hypothetical protein